MSHLLISAAHKSSGKTLLSIGICAALNKRSYHIQAFKKGPDYIDPMWLGLASGRACYNLDFYTMTQAEIELKYHSFSQQSDITLIEGNKGLYDGLDLDGSNSNAALAELLQVPVILVLDAQGMTRGIAPLILGYQAFDPKINIAGVILNKLGGQRHESKLRAVIEHYTDVSVIGAVYRDQRLQIIERHLGLMPSNEAPQAMAKMNAIADAVAEQVDLDQIIALPKPSSFTIPKIAPSVALKAEKSEIVIGIAKDAAFGFYYPDDLEALQNAGAKLVMIDLLQDSTLPAIDGLFIGGGFPETKMAALEANDCLRQQVSNFIESGGAVYAECGGLMYLARSIHWQGKSHQMVGAIQGDIIMSESPQGRGYVQLQETDAALWSQEKQQSLVFSAHEFHYSSIKNLPADTTYAYKVLRGTGINGQYDGIVYKNTLACYAHLRDVQQNRWAKRFVDFIKDNQ